MVLDKGEAACSEYVIVGAPHAPVEVGQAELVVDHRAVADTVGGPGGQTALRQVAAQHLRGSGTREPSLAQEESAWKKRNLKKDVVYPPEHLLHVGLRIYICAF